MTEPTNPQCDCICHTDIKPSLITCWPCFRENPTNPRPPIDAIREVLHRYATDLDDAMHIPVGKAEVNVVQRIETEALARISAIVVESIGPDDRDYSHDNAGEKELAYLVGASTAANALRAELRQQWSNGGASVSGLVQPDSLVSATKQQPPTINPQEKE